MELATPRLRLREWRESDKSAIFLHINASASVMRYFPSPLTRAESDAMVDTLRDKFIQQNGWGLLGR